MKSSLYRVLTGSCMLVLLNNPVFAAFEDNFFPSGMSETLGFNQDIGMGSSDRGMSSRNTGGGDEVLDALPYEKSSSRIADDDVVAICFIKNRMLLLNSENRYTEESLDFSKLENLEINFFKRYTNLSAVDLTQMDLTGKLLTSLQQLLPSNLKSLIMRSCNIEKQRFLDFTQLIVNGKHLESITIIDPDFEVGQTAQLISAISNVPTLRYLTLTLGEMEASGCSMLKDIIVKSANTLSGLNLGFIRVDDSKSYSELLESLGTLTKLRSLEYTVFESTAQQVTTLFTSLGKLKNLSNLKICIDDYNNHDTVIAYKNAELLSNVLAGMKKLENLDVSNMDLPDSALQVICREIKVLERLKTLDISGNPVNKTTAEELSKSLRSLDNLVGFMANNCKINDESFPSLCSGLQGSGLNHLYLVGNNIGGSVSNIPVSSMKNLTALNLGANKITMDHISEFWKRISTDSNLEVVVWVGNDFSSENEAKKISLRNQISIWKKEHGITTLDLGI